MSKQLIESYYASFNARDYTKMLSLLLPGVLHDVNQGTREVGREAFAAFLQRMDESYREEVSDLVVLGDLSGRRFAAELTVHGHYLKADPGFPPARGQEYHLSAGAFFEVAHGKIARVTTYYNLADWLAQVTDGQWSVRPGPEP